MQTALLPFPIGQSVQRPEYWEGLRADEIMFQNRNPQASVLAFYDGDFGDVEGAGEQER